MSVLSWQGQIEHEFNSNLLIIANAADFAHWTGATPLPKSERRELHLWSQFTDELPEAFRPFGPAGHQFIPAATYSELEHLRDELIAYVVGRWPGTVIFKDPSDWWILVRPDGSRLNVLFYPVSDYQRCLLGRGVLTPRETAGVLKLHTFDRHRRAIIWPVGSGIVHVARHVTGRLVLAEVQAYEDENMYVEAVRQVLNSDPSALASDSLLFDISPGPLVLASAPNSADDEDEGIVHDDTTTAKPGQILNFSLADWRTSIGVALAIPAGRYAVRAATMDGDGWEASWCAFDRIPAAQSKLGSRGTKKGNGT